MNFISRSHFDVKIPSSDELPRLNNISGFIDSIPPSEIVITPITTIQREPSTGISIPFAKEMTNTDIYKRNYSKDCLKFCRKMTNLVVEQIATQTELVQSVLKFNSEVLSKLLRLLSLPFA